MKKTLAEAKRPGGENTPLPGAHVGTGSFDALNFYKEGKTLTWKKLSLRAGEEKAYGGEIGAEVRTR